ncbi:MAG TPA: hypothetical protein VIK72_11330 [Clostridiaceae bacterium]
MIIERVINTVNRKYRKPIVIIVLISTAAIILACCLFNGFTHLKDKLKESSSYEYKYKSLLKEYNSMAPFQGLNDSLEAKNETMITDNSIAEAEIPSYKSKVENNNNYYTFFNEEEAGKIKYISAAYGISLTFPVSWENKLLIEEISNNQDYKGAILINIYDKRVWPKDGLFFTIYIFYSKESYNLAEPSLAASASAYKLYDNGKKVITCVQFPEVEKDMQDMALINDAKDMAAQVYSIVKTLKVIN